MSAVYEDQESVIITGSDSPVDTPVGGSTSVNVDNDTVGVGVGLSAGSSSGLASAIIDGEPDWDSVDIDQASQSLPLNNFVLIFEGQVFSSSLNASSFTTMPTGLFEYGDLTDVQFAITFPAQGEGFTALSVSNGAATAIDSSGNQEPANIASPKHAVLSVDSKDVNNSGYTYDLKIYVKLENGMDQTITISIDQSTTSGGTRDLVKSALNDISINSKSLSVELSGDSRLIVKGTADSDISVLEFVAAKDPKNGLSPGISQVFLAGRQQSSTSTTKATYSYVEK